MLRMENVSKTYRHRGQLVTALNGANAEIPEGDFVSVVGPSGSGKSTLLLMLGGMLSPSGGRVLLDDQSIYDLDANAPCSAAEAEDRVRLPDVQPGAVPVGPGERPGSAVPGGTRRHGAARTGPTALLERVGLADRLDHKPCELSVGQQQRVALARMLANDPAVILADEPTGNLDPETSQQVIDFLEEVNARGPDRRDGDARPSGGRACQEDTQAGSRGDRLREAGPKGRHAAA